MDSGRPAAVRATGPRRVQRGVAAGRNGGGSGDGAARSLSTSTPALAPEGRNRRGVAARGGRLRGDHHERRRGAAPGGTREPGGEVAGRPGGSTHDRQSFGRGTGEPAAHRPRPTSFPRTREPRREAGRTGIATGSRGASYGPRGRGGGPSVSGGPTPGAASADGRGLMFRAVRAPQPSPGGWLSGRGRRERRAHGETRGGGGATGRDDPARGRDVPPRREPRGAFAFRYLGAGTGRSPATESDRSSSRVAAGDEQRRAPAVHRARSGRPS